MVTRKSQDQQESNSEVEQTGPDWSKVADFMDVQNVAAEYGIETLAGSYLFGDGADLVEKEFLLGVPFKVLDWRPVVDKKTNREYFTILAMANKGGQPYKVRFNDGSTGVKEQLKYVESQHGKVVIECRNGLRKSDYVNEHGAGTTFYLT